MQGFMYAFFIIFFTLLGFVIGSFLNVIIYRIPAGRSVSKGHSMCMTCGHTLGALDLVPVFSWLFLRGKCRYCGAPIASRYAKIESFTGLTFGIAAVAACEYCAPIILWPDNLSLIFFTIYFILLIAAMAVAISAMMILYDTGKCFKSFAITSLSLVFLATLLPFIMGFYGYNPSSVIFAFEFLIMTSGKIAFGVGFCCLLCILFKRKYAKTELAIDLIMLSIPCFDQFMSYGNDIIRTIITVLAYSVLMCIMRTEKLRKYSAIAAFIAILVYTAVRFCLIKIIQ